MSRPTRTTKPTTSKSTTKVNAVERELAALRKDNDGLKKRLAEVEQQIACGERMRAEMEQKLRELESKWIGEPDEAMRDSSVPDAEETRPALGEIRLRQSQGLIPPGASLLPTEPFFVHANVRLPETPTPETMDVSLSTYAVEVVVSDAEGARPISSNGFADDLTMGQRDYESVVRMEKLDPGAYTIRLSAIVPFARISERKTMKVVVGRDSV